MEQHPRDQEQCDQRRSYTVGAELEQARLRAEKSIVDAEGFKARIENPTGMNVLNSMNTVDVNVLDTSQVNEGLNEQFKIIYIGSGVSDDYFFHLTCHIDPNLINKIEKGEYVELEK